jgi:AraC-like DNA-binding protein
MPRSSSGLHGVAAAPEPDFYKVALQIHGSCVLGQDGKEAALEPGDFSIFDGRRPFRLTYHRPYRALLVMIPPKLLPISEKRIAQIGAVRMSGRQGLEGLVSTFLTRLEKEVDHVDSRDAEGLSEHVLGLLGMVFAHQADQGIESAKTARSTVLRRQIQRYVVQHLDDPAMTPTTLAQTHNISKRYLCKVFEYEGSTVAGWIRRCRLEKVRRDLEDPRLADWPVSAVGARWGLVDPSQLSRLFRNAYGLSPTEYRGRTARRTSLLR